METTLFVSLMVITATLFGAMVFFSFIMAPLIFIKLEAPVAGGFVRAIFPWYYLMVLVLSLPASLLLLWFSPVLAGLMAAVVVLTVYARQLLMPKINRLRDQMLAGDRTARKPFDFAHQVSVWINVLQLVAVFAALVLLAMGSAPA